MDQPHREDQIPGRALLDRLELTVIAVSVHCRGCGYDLRGQGGEGACPECGMPVAATVESLVDPEASRLPRLRNPRAVGNALLWLMLCALVATVALVLIPAWEHASLDPASVLWLRVPADLPLVAALAGVAAIWTVAAFRPRPGPDLESAVRRDLWLLAVAILGWIALATGQWLRAIGILAGDGVGLERRFVLAICIVTALGLVGVGGILRTIGLRSRAYRRSHAARQSVLGMVCGVAGVALGEAVRVLGDLPAAPRWGPAIGWTIELVSVVMLLIGLLYMIMNAWWIRTALCRPPPDLEDLVVPAAMPDDTRVPEEES